MACGLVASNLNLKPGECLKVRGEVAPDAKSFVLNLGKDSNNLCLHFNPRFDMHGDINTIVCNSKDGGAWGAEQRESAFPFQPGSVDAFLQNRHALRPQQTLPPKGRQDGSGPRLEISQQRRAHRTPLTADV